MIASVLGTGILALPVRLAPSGFTPFVASYTLGLVMQLLVLVYMCELLQRSDKAWTAMCARSGLVRPGLSEIDDNDDDDDDNDNDILRLTCTAQDAGEADLHTMGSLFLSKVARVLFDIAVMSHLYDVFETVAIDYDDQGH